MAGLGMARDFRGIQCIAPGDGTGKEVGQILDRENNAYFKQVYIDNPADGGKTYVNVTSVTTAVADPWFVTNNQYLTKPFNPGTKRIAIGTNTTAVDVEPSGIIVEGAGNTEITNVTKITMFGDINMNNYTLQNFNFPGFLKSVDPPGYELVQTTIPGPDQGYLKRIVAGDASILIVDDGKRLTLTAPGGGGGGGVPPGNYVTNNQYLTIPFQAGKMVMGTGSTAVDIQRVEITVGGAGLNELSNIQLITLNAGPGTRLNLNNGNVTNVVYTDFVKNNGSGTIPLVDATGRLKGLTAGAGITLTDVGLTSVLIENSGGGGGGGSPPAQFVTNLQYATPGKEFATGVLPIGTGNANRVDLEASTITVSGGNTINNVNVINATTVAATNVTTNNFTINPGGTTNFNNTTVLNVKHADFVKNTDTGTFKLVTDATAPEAPEGYIKRINAGIGIGITNDGKSLTINNLGGGGGGGTMASISLIGVKIHGTGNAVSDGYTVIYDTAAATTITPGGGGFFNCNYTIPVTGYWQLTATLHTTNNGSGVYGAASFFGPPGDVSLNAPFNNYVAASINTTSPSIFASFIMRVSDVQTCYFTAGTVLLFKSVGNASSANSIVCATLVGI